MSVLIIAEPGMTWDRKLDDAYRLIDAAKACGADVCKFQWTSSGRKIQERRKVDPKYIAIYEHGVQYPREWLELLKAHCDRVGIEFACTTYLPEDIEVIKPLVKRYKISAYESQDTQFIVKHVYPWDKTKEEVIISLNPGKPLPMNLDACSVIKTLHCISVYPAPTELMGLRQGLLYNHGLSDHTANVLTGAAAVAAGARIVEAHIRLQSTSHSNPDYGHSLVADDTACNLQGQWNCDGHDCFGQYVNNIRTVERML